MPSISQIRFTNVVYEDGMKRYNDEIFKFDGYNGAILLENGGGKTVFIQTALQAIIPHTNLSDRKIKQTLQLDNYPAHVAIEWILSENPRRYLVTCVSLFLTKEGLGSYRYVYPYQHGDRHSIEAIPFVRKGTNRPADRGEISDYYQQMTQQYINAQTFSTIKEFQQHIEEQYHIIANEWESIVKINSTEGGVEAFFDECKQTNQLFDRLLIPTVENAIAGHQQNTFADTFEKHRASFKLYKELKEQIEENKAIEEELNRYVLTYSGLNEKQQSYEQKKQRAKAVLQLIERQELEHKEALKSIQLKIEEWEKEDKAHLKRMLSMEIYKEEIDFNRAQKELRDYENALNLAQEDLAQASNSFNSLKLAELKKGYQEQQNRIQYLKNQIEILDQNEEIHEIKDKFEKNSQELIGYFLHEIEESNKRKHELKIQKQPIEEQIDHIKKLVDSKREQLEQTKKSFENNNGKMESVHQQMIRIQKRILSNPEQESVKESVQQWEKRLVYLDNQIVKLKTDNKQLAGMIAESKNQKVMLDKQKEENERARIELSHMIKQTENAHQKVKEILGVLRPQWATLDSIYLKQDSLAQQIHEHIEQLNNDRNHYLFKERIAYRFIDDYGGQDLFFADPFIEKQLKHWSNQFRLLETGVQFIQSLEDEISTDVKNYPLWPITLITTEAEKEPLKLKLKNINKEIQFPIVVITIEQARAIIKGESPDVFHITPEHWSQNQDQSYFEQWKQSMKNHAEEATSARINMEERINEWSFSKEKLVSFLKENPYREFQQRKDDYSKLVHTIQELNREQKEIHNKLSEYEEQISSQKEKIDTHQQEYNGLQGKVKDAYEYMQYEKELTDLKKIQEQLYDQINENVRVIKTYELQLERLEDEKKQIEDAERDEAYHYHTLIEDELYFEVKNFSPLYTKRPKSILREERDELKFAERKLSSTRRELKIKLDYSNNELERLSKDMREIRIDYGPLNEEIIFPPNGKEQIEYFRTKMKDKEIDVDKRRQQLNVCKEKKIRQEQKFEMATNKFQATFPNEMPEKFEVPLAEVQQHLYLEAKRLKEQNAYLHQEQKRLSKELDAIKSAFYELDRFEEAHHFRGPSVKVPVLSEEEIKDFTYRRVAFVQNVTLQLKLAKDQVMKEWEKVERAKNTFKTFCKNKITNVKMREMARQGIESKQTYKDVTEFQLHMQKRIQTAIMYNEASIINHDKQLEQFVTHIHSHLRTIAGELELIPKKTKVKVADSWKEIYKFSIPEWTDQEGKSRIRKHIEWILEQLDSQKYVTSEGKEDYGKVRKDIETWLQSKQLLRVVMNNEIMKVTCRKVTNDNQVTTRSYSWEQSNVWSGGEKWSKNMTLFLGLLNYVAEKQKHIEANMKRHRVVIMDNPFGKASSDHVLNPVFFIAEQLGFQIIALTAHAEGKFLRDYFPVIYSCRLRKAAESNKQIMTKTKQLHKAFFKDHEPQALERLGEVEQMELF